MMNNQNGYLYETHFHTAWSSACARSRGPEYLERYKRLGYSGILVTDHFWGGNCAVNRHLPWHQFVEAFCRGYEETYTAGQEMGMDVFFGWEETFDGDDYLVYGLSKEWLLQHPEVRGWTRTEQLEQVHRAGGCVVQAHPFRDRDYIHAIHLGLNCVDAVEVGNAGNLPEHDLQALRWAEKYKLYMTAGSDIHSVSQYTDDELMGVRFPQKMHTVQDFVEAIRSQSEHTLQVPRGHFDLPLEMPRLQVYQHGSKSRRIDQPEVLFG